MLRKGRLGLLLGRVLATLHLLPGRAPRTLLQMERYPEVALRHLRHLRSSGQAQAAAKLYSTVKSDRLAGVLTPREEFELARWLHGEGLTEELDPLFHCGVRGVGFADPRVLRQARVQSSFRAAITYLGLKISGTILGPQGTPVAELPSKLEILLGDCPLRVERLKYVDGKARVSFQVRREPLSLFPRRGLLRLRCADGTALPFSGNRDQLMVHVPHGSDGIGARIAASGPLDKKGALRPNAEALRVRQDAYLALYQRACAAFIAEFGKPLFVLYGTLLGQHRGGDFIPGDDDFDVGYVSDQTDPAAVKAEAMEIMARLARRGFIIGLNPKGKPHRLRDAESGVEIHLDNRPVFTRGDGQVWMHKQARLPLDLDAFRAPVKGCLRGVDVYKPAQAEAFLEAYYGPGWRVPDPAFSHSSQAVAPEIRAGLDAVCLDLAEQRALKRRIDAENPPGAFLPIALQPLYPLDRYAAAVGL